MERHLSAAEIAAAIDGRLPPAERSAIDSHLATCAACRAEFVDASAITQSAPPIVVRRRRWAPTAGLIAAAAIVFVVALPLSRGSHPDARPLDQRAASNPSAVPLVSPASAVGVPRGSLRFTWRGAAASTYRLIVTDSSGAEVYSRTTSDTTLAPPASLSLVPGARYFWFVDELRPDGSSVSSQASSFSVLP